MILRGVFAVFYLQLLALVAGQSMPMELPAITGPAADNQCGGGCYAVADVAGVYFGEQQLTQVQTQVVSVGIGRNGTNVTATSVVEGEAQFTFGPSGLVTGENGAGIQYAGSTVITVAGVALTSPTAYQVFSAYSVTSTTVSNGECVAVPGPRQTVNPAFTVEVPPNAGPDFAIDAENSFLSHVGLPTCSAGGANIVQTTNTIVNTLTETSTTMGPLAPMTPQPVSTVAQPGSTQIGYIQAVSSLLSEAQSSSAAAEATTTQVSVGTIVVVSNASGTFTGPAISVFQPGINAAPAPRSMDAAFWAGAVALAGSFAACLVL